MKKLLLFSILTISVLAGARILKPWQSTAANAQYVRDRFMKIGVCYCPGEGWVGVGFSCWRPGNDCYASQHCFCDPE